MNHCKMLPWVFRPEADAEFVAPMEKVLETYANCEKVIVDCDNLDTRGGRVLPRLRS